MKNLIVILLIITLFGSCSKEKHFITDTLYRKQVEEAFTLRKTIASQRYETLFSVFEDERLTLAEREALQFFYAYMPLSDLADYDADFFLRQIRTAFEAREYFDWGKDIPEEIFRHFVMVYRVNNENLDDARTIFFHELKDRVKGMSMGDAALEVNHWCHEMVTYRPTDGRTSAPLATRRTSWGRCGEESTFTVTALRAVGIPARQCYTPRWVHTDDNHAWVEVWVDGKWYYLGACEPEPELDMAWFTGPVKRAMMVFTKVFGNYNGPEQKNLETPLYSIINLLPNYVETKNLEVQVVDTQNNPVSNAQVQFKVYNYAELFSISTNIADQNGKASLITGYGDLIVWANNDDTYGYIKVSANETSATVVLNRKLNDVFDDSFELVPPKAQKIPEIAPEKIAANALRLKEEETIRNAYMATFFTEEKATLLFDSMGISDNNLRNELTQYLLLSQGNYAELVSFIRNNDFESPYFLPFLAALSEKDLRDTPENILSDHFNSDIKENHNQTVDFWAKYVLSPRIERELIRPWRSFLNKEFSQLGLENITALQLIDWIQNNITILNDDNYYNCPISPRGVYELRHSDYLSRNIFFVAVCRTANIPARLEPATSKPQYFENNQWIDAIFDSETDILSEKSIITFDNFEQNIIKPKYTIHYTVANFQNGDFVPLNYYDDPILKKLPASIHADIGYYRLMTGSRANDGSVTIYQSAFNLTQNDTKNLIIELPQIVGKMHVIGGVDLNTRINKVDGNHTTLKDLSHEKGVCLAFIDHRKEPSKHLLNDLATNKTYLEEWNGAVVIMMPDDKLSSEFDFSVYKNLPSQHVWAVDDNRSLLKNVSNSLQLDFVENFPLCVFIDNNGGILFYSEGYQIGVGEKIIKIINEINLK